MARTYYHTFTRETCNPAVDVTIEYSMSGGCSAHMGSLNYAGHPAEAPELEFIKAWIEPDGTPTELTTEESELEYQHICENPPEDDYFED